MLDKELTKLLNKQICMEFYSAYLYMHMANYYAEQGLDGFESWFHLQAQEERDHALLIRTYMLNNDASIDLLPIDAPTEKYTDFLAPLKATLAHEQEVTASIHAIYDVAHSKKDYRTMQFLDWFVMEQGEEEKTASDLIQKYELFVSGTKGLYPLDQQMAARTYSPPSLTLD